jgi:hypothetical protein
MKILVVVGKVPCCGGKKEKSTSSLYPALVGRVSVAVRRCLLGPAGAYCDVSECMVTCYCLDRHCVLKSLATPRLIVTRQLLPIVLCTPVCCAQHARVADSLLIWVPRTHHTHLLLRPCMGFDQ